MTKGTKQSRSSGGIPFNPERRQFMKKAVPWALGGGVALTAAACGLSLRSQEPGTGHPQTTTEPTKPHESNSVWTNFAPSENFRQPTLNEHEILSKYMWVGDKLADGSPMPAWLKATNIMYLYHEPYETKYDLSNFARASIVDTPTGETYLLTTKHTASGFGNAPNQQLYVPGNGLISINLGDPNSFSGTQYNLDLGDDTAALLMAPALTKKLQGLEPLSMVRETASMKYLTGQETGRHFAFFGIDGSFKAVNSERDSEGRLYVASFDLRTPLLRSPEQNLCQGDSGTGIIMFDDNNVPVGIAGVLRSALTGHKSMQFVLTQNEDGVYCSDVFAPSLIK